jgi:hypothetical protein
MKPSLSQSYTSTFKVYFAGYLRNLHASSTSEGSLRETTYGLITHSTLDTASVFSSVSGSAPTKYLAVSDTVGVLRSVSRSITAGSSSNTTTTLHSLGWGLSLKDSTSSSSGALQGAVLALPLWTCANAYSTSPILSMLVPVAPTYTANLATLVKLTHSSKSLVGTSYATAGIRLDRALRLVPASAESTSYQVKGGLTLSTPFHSRITAEGVLGSTTGVLSSPKVSSSELVYTGITSFYTINEEGNTIAAPGVLLLNYVAEIAYNRIYYSQATAPRIFYSGGI